MGKYIFYSEEEEVYDSKYHGHFNKRLAEWAISRMVRENPTSGVLESVKRRTYEDYDELIKEYKLDIPVESYYDGYYLLHMAIADYGRALEDDKHRAMFVEETICDPDGERTSVLACFKAKMNEANEPIFFERFL